MSGLFKRNEEKKDKNKKNALVHKVETQTDESLKKIYEEEKSKSAILPSNELVKPNETSQLIKNNVTDTTIEQSEQIAPYWDATTGEIDLPAKPNESLPKKNNFAQSFERWKGKDKKGKKALVNIPKVTYIPPPLPPVKADISIICIEITDSFQKISQLVKASLKLYNTRFYKFVFFNKSVYSTEIMIKSLISMEKILEIVKVQQEIASELENDNVLLYDAIDETISFSKEKEFFEKRKITINKTDYIMEEIKYLFVISGEEKGSCITKNELQNVLSDVRTQDSDVHLVLTKSENLLKMASLGFRSIKSH